MNSAENQQSRMGRGRSQGMCKNRNENSDYSQNHRKKNMGNLCKRFGETSLQVDQSVEAEAVIGEQKRSYTSNLQMLKEQANRLAQALKNIEAQIKSFEAEK